MAYGTGYPGGYGDDDELDLTPQIPAISLLSAAATTASSLPATSPN